jgi:hypothetical protein
VAKKDSVEDDNGTIDDIETHDSREIIEKVTSAKDASEARRRLEKVLEDKALERLINGDFYD